MSDTDSDEHESMFLWATEDAYGFTKGKSYADKLRNFQRRTTFRLKPIAFVADENIPSIQYQVMYFISKRVYNVTIADSEKNDFKAVCVKLMNQYPEELAEGSLSPKDFKKIQIRHFNIWCEKAFAKKVPVRYIGLQHHLLGEFSEWTPDKIEFFFSEETGVLGINGCPKPNSQAVYVREIMKGVPKMDCIMGGFGSFVRHFEPPFTSNQGGVEYFESVNCTANIGLMTFHAPWYRGKFGKLGMVCIAGPPNIAKTSSVKCSMHLASALEYFFSMKATPELIQFVCERVGLLVSYDDNDSLRKEEILGVSRFDGGAIGNKGQGIKTMVGEVVLTSNDTSRRSDKMKLGRVYVLKKMFAGYSEGDNMLEALYNLAGINEALKDKRKPLDYLVASTSLWFKTVTIPESASKVLSGKAASQMLVWFAQTCQKIRDLTGGSLREIFTIAALNMWVFLYDEVLPKQNQWHKNGGSKAYFSPGGYFHLLLLEEADTYGQPLQNPGGTLEDRFLVFIKQLLDSIDNRLADISDPGVQGNPGDFVPEIRLVWSKLTQTSDKDICLAIVKSVNYREVFQTEDNITVFEELVKKLGGSPNFKVVSDFQGKQSHRAVAIGLKYFDRAIQKRIINSLVRSSIRSKCKMYGSIRRRKMVEESRQENSDYNDSGDETEEVAFVEPLSRARASVSSSQVLARTQAAPPQPPSLSVAETLDLSVAVPSIPDSVAVSSVAVSSVAVSSVAVSSVPVSSVAVSSVAVSSVAVSSVAAIPTATLAVTNNPPLALGVISDLSMTAVSPPNPLMSVGVEGVSPSPSQGNATLLATLTHSGMGKDLPGSSNMPVSGGMSEQACFQLQDEIKQPEILPVFDPECENELGEDSDDYDEDEGDVFRKKAIDIQSNSRPRMVKTRSQTEASQSSSEADWTGRIVFAHKGKKIPCWFPGRVLQKSKKGYDILFYSKMGTEACSSRNTMLYEDYFVQKDDKSTLFKVPTKLKKQFEDGMRAADRHNKM